MKTETERGSFETAGKCPGAERSASHGLKDSDGTKVIAKSEEEASIGNIQNARDQAAGENCLN
jgi:hypothetical protein